MQTLKVRKLKDTAVVPQYMTPGAAGMDLTATDLEIIPIVNWTSEDDDAKYVYGTGLAFEIPEGHVGLIFPRSSIHKTEMDLTNCVGVIDSDYRGEVKFVFRTRKSGAVYAVGDRIGQLVIVQLPRVQIKEVEALSDTERGSSGFGSTGR